MSHAKIVANIITRSSAVAITLTFAEIICPINPNKQTATSESPVNFPSTSFIQFLGSGSSTGCPRTSCVFPSPLPSSSRRCETSHAALIGDPRNNKDHRGNPSLLISHSPQGSENRTNVIIDCGKTFRDSLLRVRPSIASLDGLVLTHEHMDAYGGLDDIRGVQLHSSPPLPVNLSEKTMEVVGRAFPYLVPKDELGKKGESGCKNCGEEVKRHVSSLAFTVFSPFASFFPVPSSTFSMYPLPFVHGEDCTCYGFAFGGKDKVLYMSDLSRIGNDTKRWITEWMEGGGIDVLVIDSLLVERDHPTHISLKKAREIIRELRPKRTYIVGISCDDWPTHDKANLMLVEMFKDDDLKVEMAWDGLKIELDL